jgi:hypothetical protein
MSSLIYRINSVLSRMIADTPLSRDLSRIVIGRPSGV